MRLVVALGGNALMRRGEAQTAVAQRENIAAAARVLAELADGNDLVVTHGNGPQVGLLALQAAAHDREHPWPLDVLDAQSEGMIGYVIERELSSVLPHRRVATLLTQVEVAADDPAFSTPEKPVGPVYDAATAAGIADKFGWTMARDGAGGGLRRVVASPRPVRIVEISAIRHLVAEGIIVVCAGGGGIPVAVTPGGGVVGVEAVIDKDRTAALLAREIGADALLLLSDVEGVFERWGEDEARLLESLSATDVTGLALDPGSMGPKVEAACRFAAETGKIAAIGHLDKARDILAGRSGTRIMAPSAPVP